MRQLIGDATPFRRLLDEIVERTDGVPLFVEEVTKVILEAVGTLRKLTCAHRSLDYPGPPYCGTCDLAGVANGSTRSAWAESA